MFDFELHYCATGGLKWVLKISWTMHKIFILFLFLKVHLDI